MYDFLDDHLLAKPGVVKDFKVEWNATRYLVGGKMFVMLGQDKEKREIITLKLEPANGQLLRRQYPAIVPGYYMNKEHWNSVYPDGTVSDDVLRGLVDQSYQLVFTSLSKKLQAELTGG